MKQPWPPNLMRDKTASLCASRARIYAQGEVVSTWLLDTPALIGAPLFASILRDAISRCLRQNCAEVSGCCSNASSQQWVPVDTIDVQSV